MERWLTSDELDHLHSQFGSFSQNLDPILCRHVAEQRKTGARCFVAVRAFEVALTSQFEPEEGKRVGTLSAFTAKIVKKRD